MNKIPQQLQDFGRFIKLEPQSKEPKFSPEGPFFESTDTELVEWLNHEGNVGLNLGPLVAVDVDHEEFRQLIEEYLPATFSVRSGSGGEHRYYRSRWDGRTQFSQDGADMGSIRSGNWYVVVPPSVHPNGNQYHVLQNRPIQPVPSDAIAGLIEEANDRFGTASTGGGGGGAGSSDIPDIPTEYPEKPAEWGTMKKWLSANDFLDWFDQTGSTDWSGIEWTIAKCLAEGGFSEGSISDALDRLHHNSKWHQRGKKYRTRTVRKAIRAAYDDPYVEFSNTGDMACSKAESRKTEFLNEVKEKMAEQATFTDLYTVPILEGSDDGDSFRSLVLVEGDDGSETFEFLQLRKGRVQEAQTPDGETVLVQDVQKQVSLGSPDYLDELIEGLDKMAEQLDE